MEIGKSKLNVKIGKILGNLDGLAAMLLYTTFDFIFDRAPGNQQYHHFTQNSSQNQS